MRKQISVEELSQKNSRQIIDDISHAHYSLLRSLGCGKMIRGFAWVRWMCLFFINMARRRARRKFMCIDPELANKHELSKIFERGAPSYVWTLHYDFPQTDCGIVIGFNHPSLGEIIRLIGICMRVYPNRRYLFPVNIVWYEALSPVMERLNALELYLTPIITPSAKERMLACAKTAEQKAEIERLSSGFSTVYLNTCCDFVAKKQIALVAPSAKRQATVFRNISTEHGYEAIEPQTMTILAMSLIRKKLDFAFLPIAVIPPPDSGKGLNLLKLYRILPCPPVSAQMTKRMCEERETDCKSRRFERYFLEIIASALKSSGAKDMLHGSDYD